MLLQYAADEENAPPNLWDLDLARQVFATYDLDYYNTVSLGLIPKVSKK